jgi:predicted dehydrogenase
MMRVGVGVIGCGNILGAYVLGLRRLAPVRLVGCADLDVSRAHAAAEAHRVRAFASVEALLCDESVEVVVNLTPPLAHGAVSRAALEGGKRVFSEKPIAATVTEADSVLAALAEPGRMGSAPDTFLAGPGQTARAAIDAGLIGEPIGASAAIAHSRAEEWHPDPTFLFRQGGGPLLDMGPYYISSLVNCLGPVDTVRGATRIGANPRPVTAPDRLVEAITVEVPTHAAAVLTFASGAVATLTASFDLWSEHLPPIEIYGTKGVLRLPNPDFFDGDVTVRLNAGDRWQVVPPTMQLAGWGQRGEYLRGLGVADLIESLDARPQRTTAALGYHVLEVLEAIQVSSDRETVVRIASAPGRPAPVEAGDLAGLAVPGPSSGYGRGEGRAT